MARRQWRDYQDELDQLAELDDRYEALIRRPRNARRTRALQTDAPTRDLASTSANAEKLARAEAWGTPY